MKKLAYEDIQNKFTLVSLPDHVAAHFYKVVAEISLIKSNLNDDFSDLLNRFDVYRGNIFTYDETLYSEITIQDLTESQQITFTELPHLFPEINESYLERFYQLILRAVNGENPPSKYLLDSIAAYSAELADTVKLMVNKINANEPYDLSWFSA